MSANNVLENIAWAFKSTRYPTAAAFNEAVTDYNTRIMKEHNTWNPDEVVITAPVAEVCYEYWTSDEDEQEATLQLHAENGKNFTVLEVLYKLHEEIADKELGDHVFFEGLTFDTMLDQSPRYFMYCGS